MSKDYSKFYTPQQLADALIKLIELKNNAVVVDICCGSGNLLSSAKKANHSITCYGVDIIEKEEKSFSYINEDGRAFALINENSYDFALANPPFATDSSTTFSDLLFTGDYNSINSKRLEIQMLIANLFLLKNDGTLLIIMPTTFAEGSRYQNIRKIIAANTYIKTIIDLPSTAFSPYIIKCCALIIQKTKNEHNLSTKYYNMDSSLQISQNATLLASTVKSGNWIKRKEANYSNFLIKQGKISSNHFTQSGIPVLHIGKKDEPWNPSVRYSNISLGHDQVKAEKGDIIVSRIGYTAGQKCLYDGESTYISDCLFVIKAEDEDTKKRIMKLDFTSLVVGLSTPYITAKGINELYQSYTQ